MIFRLRALFLSFTTMLMLAVLIARALPADGALLQACELATTLGVALLFFLHGARLSREAVMAGVLHWRLQLLVFACTFALFPLLGWALRPAVEPLLGAPLYAGVLYLCVLPGTVQSAIAFTAVARGNLPAAICSASASSLAGLVLTPLWLRFLLDAGTGMVSIGDAAVRLGMQLLLPFLIGHLLRPLLADTVERMRGTLGLLDQGIILLVVYTAFCGSVKEGLWKVLPARDLGLLAAVCAGLLALVLYANVALARALGLSKEDEIAVVFCGSKKSLATGAPMAQALFSGGAAGVVVLPLMIFHQLQLMACAVLARRYAQRPGSTPA